jgi:hypothetical protein
MEMRPRPGRTSRLLALGAGLVLALAGVALAVDFVRYDSPALPSSRAGVVYSLRYPAGWAVAWGGERVRLYDPAASEGPLSARTFIHVDAIARDERGVDALLNDANGIERWLTATRPRFEVEDHRKVKTGATGETRDALLVRDPAHGEEPDRRILFVLVPAGDVNLVLRLSAPKAEFARRDPLWKDVLASFEPAGS